MTKLEQKLIELGYVLDNVEYYKNEPLFSKYEKYFKHCRIVASVCHKIENQCDSYNLYVKADTDSFAIKVFLDSLQQAFNEMQKDLEILKELENGK